MSSTEVIGDRFRTTVRALNHRNFRLFFSGQLVSLIGTWMQSVAQAWLVYRLTDSVVLLGAVGFAGQIPVFLLSPIGGAIADQHSRHRILLITQSLSMVLALSLGLLTLGGMIEVWHIFLIAASMGTVNAFDIPTRQSFVYEMVGRADLQNAIALNSSMFNAARVVGPAVAGVLVSWVGEAWCFLINGTSYVAVLAGLLAMRLPAHVRVVSTDSPVQRILGGFRFVARTGPIRALLLLLALVSFVAMPYTVLMPVFAREILGGGARSLGMLMGAAGVGALAGSITLASRRSVRGLGRWIAAAAAGFGASLVLFSFSRDLWLSILLLVPVGFTMVVQMAASNTLIQSMVPDELRGRVMALYSMIFMGMAPLGSLLSGTIAEKVGAPMAVAIGGSVCMVGALVFFLRLPAHRFAAYRLLLTQQMVGGDPAEEVTGTGADGLTAK